MELNQQYQRESFISFLKETLLNDFDKDIRTVNTQGLGSIKKAFSLGKSKVLDLQIFEFEFTGSSRKRIALTKEAFKLMRDSACYQALAVFHSANSETWRLSFLTADPVKTEKGSVGLVYSNPKRYSFLLGVHAKTNTPKKYLVGKGKIVDLPDLKKRFSIEVVNKDFYKEVSNAFTHLVGDKLKLPSTQSHSQTDLEFAVRLIGRIIFCWFLREKRSSTGHPLMPIELISGNAAKEIPDYYHKILEPIFFEILNRPIKSRKDSFTKGLFSSIPYLNGGLFSPHEDDFYSYNEGKQAINHNLVVIPDDWFKSFFEALETYNFTIDENTSYDEELSIDPEMLGRIFENLLAEINPETGESARKSTGSYYTPRIIVDYMVDESLLLYLKEKTQIKEEKLRALISYDLDDDLSNPLSDEEREKVTEALNSVKILDPACGSGAFPIGALQKIVFILQQIDPAGQLWFKNQIQNTPIELKRLIEREFQEKNFDYLRKLGIIRENIYGIDIQPIATEISRLRCFLTLIVDERIDETLDNRGIEPLPNLDFKFVTANSLIGLPETESPQGELFDDNAKIDQLKSLRDQYFNARNEERKDLMIEFSELQSEMINELIDKHSFTGVAKAELTRKLTDWKPFKHKKTDWFDPEWMFGMKEGFDVVISNPPYGNIFTNKDIFKEIKKKYITAEYKIDAYSVFVEKGLSLCNKMGKVSYIVPYTFLSGTYFSKLRKFIFDHELLSLIVLGKKVFQAAEVDTCILLMQRTKNRNYVEVADFRMTTALKQIQKFRTNQIPKDLIFQSYSNVICIGEIPQLRIFKKISLINNTLENYLIYYHGLQSRGNDKAITTKKTQEALPLIQGKDFNRYSFSPEVKYFIYKPENIKSGGDLSYHHTSPKIVIRTTADSIVATIDDNKYLALNSVNIAILKVKDYSLKFLLAILNSKLVDFWYLLSVQEPGKTFAEVKIVYLKNIPIPPFAERNQPIIFKVEQLVDLIIISKKNDSKTDTKNLENQLNNLIYKLYGLTEEEIKIVEKS